MIECPQCERKFSPSSAEINICPHCGHASGEGMLHLFDSEQGLSKEERGFGQSMTRTMGKVALLVLLLGSISVLLYSYVSYDPKISENALP